MQKERSGVQLCVHDCEAAAAWLQKHLFFEQQEDITDLGVCLQNNACTIYLKEGVPAKAEVPAGFYFTGLAHIALACADIDAAIRYAQSRHLQLELADGKSFFNPKVFGSGEYFFNIISPFGVIFEVSQRAAGAKLSASPILCGLDHIGLPAADFAGESAYFKKNGFTPEFEPVLNYNEEEGHIRCVMLSRNGITLEIYSFEDMLPSKNAGTGPIISLTGLDFTGSSPSGVQII